MRAAAAPLLGAIGAALTRGVAPLQPHAPGAGQQQGHPARGRGRGGGRGGRGEPAGVAKAAAALPPPPPATLLFDWLLPLLAGQLDLPVSGGRAGPDAQVGVRGESLLATCNMPLNRCAPAACAFG